MKAASRAESRMDGVRIEFGWLRCGDLATAPVSRRTAPVAACWTRVFVIETERSALPPYVRLAPALERWVVVAGFMREGRFTKQTFPPVFTLTW